MPECFKCHEYYFGHPDTCPRCGINLEAKPAPITRQGSFQSRIAPPARPAAVSAPGPDERTCYEADTLGKWGGRLFGVCIAIAILGFIAGGFQVSLDRYGALATTFSFSAMFSVGSIINALVWIGGGFVLNLLLKSFAVIVEASYRSMKKE